MKVTKNDISKLYKKLCEIFSTNKDISNKVATEATLQQLIVATSNGQDFEARQVEDSNGDTYLEVRVWDGASQSWNAPLYYLPGSNTGVPLSSMAAPINYLNNSNILSNINTNTTGIAKEVTQQTISTATAAILSGTNTIASNITTLGDDIEILIVKDTGNSDKVVQQINKYDNSLDVWSTEYKDVDGNLYTPIGPLEYLDSTIVSATPTLSDTSNITAVTSSATSITLKAANTSRRSIKITNNASEDLLLKEGNTASASSFTWRVLEGETVIIVDYNGILDGIWEGTPTGNAMVTETIL